MFAVIVAFMLLTFQPAYPTTVEQCLLQSGYSTTVTPSEISGVWGVPAPEWETVLAQGQIVGVQQAQTDTGRRMLIVYAWGGSLYVFVGKSEHDPGVRGVGESRSVVHGDCLLRIGNG